MGKGCVCDGPITTEMCMNAVLGSSVRESADQKKCKCADGEYVLKEAHVCDSVGTFSRYFEWSKLVGKGCKCGVVSPELCANAVEGATLRQSASQHAMDKCKCPRGTFVVGTDDNRTEDMPLLRRHFDPHVMSGKGAFCKASPPGLYD